LVIRGGYLMIPIGLCSVVALAVMIEKLVELRRARGEVRSFMLHAEPRMREGNQVGLLDACRRQGGPLASIFRSGLEEAGRGVEAMDEAMARTGEREVMRLRRHLGALTTIVGGAPLLGFLGTVVGMIQAFMKIEQLGGNVNASVLAGGIWQALLTTAAGLSVAAPTFFVHSYLESSIRALVVELEENSSRLIEVAKEWGR